MDTQGLQFQIGTMKEQRTVEVHVGKKMKIYSDASKEGDEDSIYVTCGILPQVAKVGNVFHINRKILCDVTKVNEVGFITFEF